MRPSQKCIFLFLLLTLGAACAGRSAPTPDDEARFLAGLPVTDLALVPLMHTAGWTAHSGDFNQAWAELDKHQLQPIAAWASGTSGTSGTVSTLGHFYTDTGPVVYFFSGPDFLYAHAFFPNASTYVLCGIEPIGPLPQVEDLPPETLGATLATMRDSLDSLLNFSFFITKKMKVQLVDSRLTGTLPILYVFLARTGCHIDDVSFTGVDPKGQITTARTVAPAVKITFHQVGGPVQTLYYFSTDLSDGPIEKSGFLTWCTGLGQARGFLKAASYLMHSSGFDSTRKFLLGDCAAILQDDSGIPIRFFAPHDWDVRLFGEYKGPIAIFKQFPQPEIDQLKAVQKPVPLPFSVGYRWHPGESSLILAVRAGHASE
jgi:hypothetical protein